MLNRTITYRVMTGLATLLFIVLLIMVYFNSNEPHSPPRAKDSPQKLAVYAHPRPQTPHIVWKDAQGIKRSLKQYKNQVLYINLWALWCEPCKQEIPFLANLASKHFNQSLKILLINMDENTEEIQKAKNFLKNAAPQLEGYFAVGKIFMDAFNAEVLPTHILIDKEGHLAASFFGDLQNSETEFKQVLQTLLQEN